MIKDLFISLAALAAVAVGVVYTLGLGIIQLLLITSPLWIWFVIF